MLHCPLLDSASALGHHRKRGLAVRNITVTEEYYNAGFLKKLKIMLKNKRKNKIKDLHDNSKLNVYLM